jgi:hypothetical protein
MIIQKILKCFREVTSFLSGNPQMLREVTSVLSKILEKECEGYEKKLGGLKHDWLIRNIYNL